MFTKAMSRCLPPTMRKQTTKREFALRVIADGDTVVAHDFFWSGGSRNVYWFHNMATGENRSPVLPSSPFQGVHSVALEPQADEVVVEGGTFLGKPVMLRVSIPLATTAEFCKRSPELATAVAFALTRFHRQAFVPDAHPLTIADWCDDNEYPVVAETIRKIFDKPVAVATA